MIVRSPYEWCARGPMLPDEQEPGVFRYQITFEGRGPGPGSLPISHVPLVDNTSSCDSPRMPTEVAKKLELGQHKAKWESKLGCKWGFGWTTNRWTHTGPDLTHPCQTRPGPATDPELRHLPAGQPLEGTTGVPRSGCRKRQLV